MNILLRRRGLGNGSCTGIQAASTTGLTVMRNDNIQAADLHYIFRWGCTSTIGAPAGAVVINPAASIHWCSAKKQGRMDMQEAGVSVPETWDSLDFIRNHSTLEGQFVLRRATHAQGRDLWHGDAAAICSAYRANGVVPGYVSRLINKVAEYRVMVVSGRVAWVAKKTPGNPDDVAWNVAQGGRFDNVRWGDWPRAVVEQALKAAIVSKTDFCGVDVMVDADDKAYVLEVNSAPSQTSPYRQSCVAKAFDYIVTNGRDKFPLPEKYGWKSTIHPALIQE